jgi:hypothetical protein
MKTFPVDMDDELIKKQLDKFYKELSESDMWFDVIDSGISVEHTGHGFKFWRLQSNQVWKKSS